MRRRGARRGRPGFEERRWHDGVGGWVANAAGVAGDPRPTAPLTAVAVATGADAYRGEGADGRGVDVALIDSGVARVPGLAGAVVDGPDLTPEAGTAAAFRDGFGHGTHLAGIMAGPVGLAPGARVVSVKVADRRGTTDLRSVVAGIDWVVRNRDTGGRAIRVLNLSLAADAFAGEQPDPLGAALERAWRAGIVVVVAAGNGGADAPGLDHPATEPFVLAVGASVGSRTGDRRDDAVAPFSSRGDDRRVPDLVAPGTSLVSLRAPGSDTDRRSPSARVGTTGFRGSGTSQAAAVVSGAAALVLSRSPGLAPDQVKALLTATATPLAGTDRRAQGAGVLDLRRAATTAPPAALSPLGPAPAPVLPATAEHLDLAVGWSGNRWSADRWSGNRWSGNRWSSASWGS